MQRPKLTRKPQPTQCAACGGPLDSATQRDICSSCCAQLGLDPTVKSEPACPYDPDCFNWVICGNGQPPGHVCEGIARVTCLRWARQHLRPTPFYERWQQQWPLPLGEQALLNWAIQQEADSFAPHHLNEYRAQLPPAFTDAPDLTAGLIIERPHVTLFGAIVMGDGDSALDGFNRTVTMPDGTHIVLTPVYVYAAPEVHCRSTSAAKTARALERWYLPLIGQRVGAGGRPKGRSYTKVQFAKSYPEAYEACLKRSIRPPDAVDVATELGLSYDAFLEHRKDYGHTWPPT